MRFERPRRRYSLLTRRDKIVMGLMVGIPTFLCLALIWFPTVFSVGLSFTNWQGYTGLEAKNFIGLKNYETLFTAYQPFWPAVWHNILWLLVFVFIATPIGIFLAVLLDREMRGTRLYQSAFFIPVVLSLAVVGIIWQLQYTLAGLHQQRPRAGRARAMSSTGWATRTSTSGPCWSRPAGGTSGYVMVLYLAGLKSVDPTLREAAAIDGANARQTFFRVVFPVMRPINVVIVVVTVIESLRAFDIVYIINQGKNGLELLSVLITNASIGEASLLGFGSAIAVVLLVVSLVPIIDLPDPHDAGGPGVTRLGRTRSPWRPRPSGRGAGSAGSASRSTSS